MSDSKFRLCMRVQNVADADAKMKNLKDSKNLFTSELTEADEDRSTLQGINHIYGSRETSASPFSSEFT